MEEESCRPWNGQEKIACYVVLEMLDWVIRMMKLLVKNPKNTDVPHFETLGPETKGQYG